MLGNFCEWKKTSKMNKKIQNKVMKIYREVAGDIPTIQERLKRCSPKYQKQQYVPLHRMEEGVKEAIKLMEEEVKEAKQYYFKLEQDYLKLHKELEQQKAEFKKMIEEVIGNHKIDLTTSRRRDFLHVKRKILAKLGDKIKW